MKINRYPLIEKILFYPVILNPLCVIVLLTMAGWVLASGWWTCKTMPAYYHFFATTSRFKSLMREIIEIAVWFAVNTVQFNKSLSCSYAEYLVSKWLPEYPKGDSRNEHETQEAYKRYILHKATQK